MAKKQRKYDTEYKVQAVKLAKEFGGAKAAREGRLDTGYGSHPPQTAMTTM